MSNMDGLRFCRLLVQRLTMRESVWPSLQLMGGSQCKNPPVFKEDDCAKDDINYYIWMVLIHRDRIVDFDSVKGGPCDFFVIW